MWAARRKPKTPDSFGHLGRKVGPIDSFLKDDAMNEVTTPLSPLKKLSSLLDRLFSIVFMLAYMGEVIAGAYFSWKRDFQFATYNFVLAILFLQMYKFEKNN